MRSPTSEKQPSRKPLKLALVLSWVTLRDDPSSRRRSDIVRTTRRTLSIHGHSFDEALRLLLRRDVRAEVHQRELVRRTWTLDSEFAGKCRSVIDEVGHGNYLLAEKTRPCRSAVLPEFEAAPNERSTVDDFVRAKPTFAVPRARRFVTDRRAPITSSFSLLLLEHANPIAVAEDLTEVF